MTDQSAQSENRHTSKIPPKTNIREHGKICIHEQEQDTTRSKIMSISGTKTKIDQ